MATEETTNLPAERVRFDPEDLRSLSSLDDAMRLVAERMGGVVADATTEIGDGFTLLEDKAALINVPFLALQWTFTPGDFGEDYCVMRVLDANGGKWVVTDGGTGLASQIREYEARTGNTGGLYVPRGLRKSEYDNEHGHGITYYLNV